MIRLAKIHLIVFALAFLLPGMSAGNEKYPLLAETPVVATSVKAQQEKATAPASGNTINEIKVAAVRLIAPEAQVASNPELGAAPEEPVEPGEPTVSELPVLIAVIIDDLGNQRGAGERTVELEGPVACAIMPHTRHATYLAQRAFAVGKEVMLHLPMQPMQMQRIAGPGEISLDTKRRQLKHILQTDLDSVPHVVGVNNHMGSLITRHPGHMRWLMEELSRRGDLFFVDSYTTPSSVAYDMAVEKGVPAARRHVFLDNEPTAEHVSRQFERLKHQADINGYAIAIGHPYHVTLDFLEKTLPGLSEHGYKLVSVETIIKLQNDQQPEDPAVGEPLQTANAIL